MNEGRQDKVREEGGAVIDTAAGDNESAPGKFELGGSSSTDKVKLLNNGENDIVSNNSVKGAVFLMLNSMIGSGIFNQPQVYALAGIWQSVLMSIVAAIFTWLGLQVLIDSGTQHNKYDYGELAKFAFGNVGEFIVDLVIALGNFGANLSYVVIIGGSFSDMLFDWGCTDEAGCGPYLWTVIFVLFFVLPLCIKRYFGHLTFISSISLASICIVVMLVLIGGPATSSNRNYDFGTPRGFATKIGSIVFAFGCGFAALPTYKSMEKMTPENWMAVSRLTVILGFILLFVVGLVGSLSFGSETNGYILNNFHGGYSYIFKLLVIFHLVLYIPLEFLVMRSSLIKIFGQKTGQLENNIYHLCTTVGLLCLLILIALLVRATGRNTGDSFGLFLDLTGGITGSFVSFILPGAIYLKVMPVTSKYYSLSALMLIFGVIILIVVPSFAFQ